MREHSVMYCPIPVGQLIRFCDKKCVDAMLTEKRDGDISHVWALKSQILVELVEAYEKEKHVQ